MPTVSQVHCPSLGLKHSGRYDRPAGSQGIALLPAVCHSSADRRPGQRLMRPVEERFWAKVDKSAGPDGCWLWTAGTHRGYGWFNSQGPAILAHRFSWEIVNGPIPDGLFVLHNCPDGDNTRCVNPRHLWLGTRAQNNADRDAKGRHVALRGEQNGAAKLTVDAVVEIREAIGRGIPQTVLAKRFAVTKSTIWLIAHNKKWRHLPPTEGGAAA